MKRGKSETVTSAWLTKSNHKCQEQLIDTDKIVYNSYEINIWIKNRINFLYFNFNFLYTRKTVELRKRQKNYKQWTDKTYYWYAECVTELPHIKYFFYLQYFEKTLIEYYTVLSRVKQKYFYFGRRRQEILQVILNFDIVYYTFLLVSGLTLKPALRYMYNLLVS